MNELSKAYNPQETEENIYKTWEKSGFFNPDVCIKKGICKKNAKPFCIVLPPPNVTGTLHMGHAAMLAIEDVLVRKARMQGLKTLWIPGTDHAAIATESKVEAELVKKEKKTRHDLGRENFLELVQKFAQESHDTIVHQLKSMGSSLDWSREAYTLDEPRSLATRTAFRRMYEEGLIYRGDRIVNWDPRMQTTVSDDEIEWKEEQAPFYYLKYGPFTIGTSRPETKFGDKYVVMHPNDKRYKAYKHGQRIEVKWIDGPVTATIIKDKSIDQSFGTGVMTITPWHDKTDFEIAQRHNLEKEQIIDLKGKLLPIANEFAGIHIVKARPLLVEKLQKKGLLESVDKTYTHRVAMNSRGGATLEPQIMRQWFINVTKEFPFPHGNVKGIEKGQQVTLKKLMLHAVKTKQIEILPKRFEKIYYHWINNLQDWCISRQIWFGHQIPVYYCKQENSKLKCKDPIVSIQQITICPYCDGPIEQDSDTLDTWFSSGLWTLSTLGWPKKTGDLETYHPTSVLETGYDIIFFWVARMILMTTYLTGEVPFKTVYLHGMVRDDQGRKMSKSLGNIINPLDMAQKYGADATRLSLLIGAAPGNDLKLSEDRIRGYRNFMNKLWNITRFTLLHTQDYKPGVKELLNKEDKKIFQEFRNVAKKTTTLMDSLRLSQAAELLYHYAWHTFADNIIEESKPLLQGEDKKKRHSRQQLLTLILGDILKLLHPFIPFVTEDLYTKLPGKKKAQLLMVEKWPA
ncbi:MAG: valine--tRNA ligase [bacterium]|nr:valine--tRNA ligase [bacterium]